jgi:heme/copper-type cytochrome/quinol oxidase subunit 2
MPEEIPTGVFTVIVVIQLLVAGVLIALIVKLRRAIKAQGLSMDPRDLVAKLRSRRSRGAGK